MKNDFKNLSGWQAVINTIFDVAHPHTEHTLEVSDDKVVVKVNTNEADAVIASLTELLDDSTNFVQRVTYGKVVEKKPTEEIAQVKDGYFSEFPASITNYFGSSSSKIERPTIENSIDCGKNILTAIFGQNAFDSLAINVDLLFNSNKGAYSDNHIMYSTIAKHASVKQLWNDMLEALLIGFKDMQASTLKEIWLNVDRHLPTVIEESAQEDITNLKGLIQDCFGVFENKDGSVSLYFNYGRLYQYAFPPELKKQQSDDPSYTYIAIDKNHLLNHIQLLLDDGVMLRIHRDHKDDNLLQARPIFFGSTEAIEKESHYTLLIDRSGSMQSHFEKMKKEIFNFIEQIQSMKNKAKIRIVFFNDKIGPTKEFDLLESNEMQAFIQSVSAGDRTSLFASIQSELDYLKENDTDDQSNSVVVLFTDGHDTQNSNKETSLSKIQSLLSELNNVKFFTLGLGDYDDEVLRKVADYAGSPFIHMQSVDDFKQIFDYVNELIYNTVHKKIAYTTPNQRGAFSVPVNMNGNAQTTGILIPFEDELTVDVDGISLDVSITEPSMVPVASVNDIVSAMHGMALKALSDNSLTQEDKRKFLAQQLKDIADLKSEQGRSKDETQQLQQLEEFIQSYHQRMMQNHRDSNPGLTSSEENRARHDLGYVVVDDTHHDSPNPCGRKLLWVEDLADDPDNIETEKLDDFEQEVSIENSSNSVLNLLSHPVQSLNSVFDSVLCFALKYAGDVVEDCPSYFQPNSKHSIWNSPTNSQQQASLIQSEQLGITPTPTPNGFLGS